MESRIFKVAVKCFTYNHSQYIEKAMDGFCMQQTSFPYVCCIVDDGSTDGEPSILSKYVDSHFDTQNGSVVRKEETADYYMTFAQHKSNPNCFFAVYLLKYNHGSIHKPKKYYLAEWMKDCYIAMNEGDDFWTDPLKLQKQADALDMHPEVDICACAASMQKNGKEVLRISPENHETVIPVEKVILGGGRFVATNSVMYRSSILEDPDNAINLMGLDYFMQIGGSQRGGMYFLPDCMAVYRVGDDGSWTRRMRKDPVKYFNHLLRMDTAFAAFDKNTKYQYKDIVSQLKTKRVIRLFRTGLEGDLLKEQLKEMSFMGRMHFVYTFLVRVLFLR